MEDKSDLSGLRLFFLSMAIGMAAFLVSLDGMIVNVAIPTISGELGVREDAGTWIITLFSMASTLFVPMSGWLAHRIGSVPLFVASTLLFSFFSFLCGAVQTFQLLLIFRIFQGAAAGILTPLSLSLIISSFPEKKRSVAIGLWSFFVMVGPAMGPMIGGWLSDYRWPWLFFLNIPFAIYSAAVVFIILRKVNNDSFPYRNFDWMGVVLLFIGLGSLQIALNRGNIDDWFRSPFITTLFVMCFICLVFFFAWEIFHRNPFVDVVMFKHLNFFLASVTVGISMSLLFSSFVLDSLWVQEVLGYTPAWAGLTLTPVGIFPLLIYPIMGKVVGKLDLRIWIGFSFLLYACTFFWLSTINTQATFGDLAFPRLVQGIGFAMLTVPNSLIAIRGVSPDKMIFAISLFSFTRMVFVGLGIPLAVTLWTRRQTFYQWRIVERTYPGNPIFEGFLDKFSPLNLRELQVDALANDAINNQASTLGLADIYYFFGWIFVFLFFLIFLYRLPKNN